MVEDIFPLTGTDYKYFGGSLRRSAEWFYHPNMPTAYGVEFRQDDIDVARKGEGPLAQIAKDFGLSVTPLKRWVAIADRKDSGAGPAAAESAEMRELKKRNRLLEQENEILRRAAADLARDINPK